MVAKIALPKLAATVDTSGNTTTTTMPIHTPRFTVDAIQDPAKLVTQMTHMAKAVEQATEPARSQPFNKAIVFKGLKVGDSPSNVSMNHGFGEVHVRYMVCWWLADNGASAHNLQFNQTYSNESTLVLTSFVAGTIDIAVWPEA